MPSIYDITTGAQVYAILPPDKRTAKNVLLTDALLQGFTWAVARIFNAFRLGENNNYTPGVYGKYDVVKYGTRTYYSLIDGNTDDPTVTTSWAPYTGNFIGYETRQQFTGNQLTFEYALNHWFETDFRQPATNEAAPDYYLPKSDIYLITNELTAPVFRVGVTESESSSVGDLDSSGYVYDDYDFSAVYGLTIMVPAAFWAALAATDADRESTIRNFADKYAPAGVLYNIQTY